MKIAEIANEVNKDFGNRKLRYRIIKIEDSFGQKVSMMFYNHDVEHTVHLEIGKVSHCFEI